MSDPQSNMQVMLDIETLGRTPGAIVLSIGAVKFDPYVLNSRESLDTLDKFRVVIDPTTDPQGTMDPVTVQWWMHDDRQPARAQLHAHEAVDLYSALMGFAEWFGETSLPTWGNSAAFDNAILRAAFERSHIACPFMWWDDRCYRTIKALHKQYPIPEYGVPHEALSDAVRQAWHLQTILCTSIGA
jgi:hypothetical protein